MAKVFIGVGHGGKDGGACANGLREADINLVMALKMAEQLRRHGVEVRLSRTVDEDDTLEEEIAEANAFGPDLAIDVHNNAGGGDGFEVFVQTNGYAAKSRAFGEALERQIKTIGQNSRGVKTHIMPSGTDYFGFLRRINAPAVLAEGAFLDSADRFIIDTVEKQEAVGVAYAKGTLEVLGIPWMDPVATGGSDIAQKELSAIREENAALKAKIAAAQKALI